MITQQRSIEIGQSFNLAVQIASAARAQFGIAGPVDGTVIRQLENNVLADAEALFPAVLKALEGAKAQYGGQ